MLVKTFSPPLPPPNQKKRVPPQCFLGFDIIFSFHNIVFHPLKVCVDYCKSHTNCHFYTMMIC